MPLNDEDKKWLDARLDAQAKSIEARFDAQTKWLETRLDVQTRDAIEATEIKLLTEFRKWASPGELRLPSHATAVRAIDLELENFKERVSKFEPQQ